MQAWRVGLTGLCTAAVAAGVLPSADAATSGGKWAQAGGGAAHHNENLTETAITARSVKHLTAGWHRHQANTPGRVAPAVVKNTVYTVDDSATNNSDPRHLDALNASTGKLKWSRALPRDYDDDVIAPAVHDGMVIVTLSGDGGEGPADHPALVAAYKEATGRKLWSSAEPAAPQGVDDTAAKWSLVAGGRVFTVVDDGELTARNDHTGAIKWRIQVAGRGGQPGDGGDPTYGDGHLFYQGGGTLTAVNPATGRTDFTADAQIGEADLISVSHHRVVVGGRSGAAAFSTRGCSQESDCKPLWTHKWSDQEDVSLSALDPQNAFFIGREATNTGGDKTNIYALDPATGHQRWQGSVPLNIGLGDLTRAANVLLATTAFNGRMYAFPVACSTPCHSIWSHRVGPAGDAGWPKSDPVVVGHRVYVAAEDYGLATFTIPAKWRP